MYFCENPKCLFHIHVIRSLYIYTLPPDIISSRINPSESVHARNITREKHLWSNPGKHTVWFFCDVCHEAAKMVERG